MRRFRPQRVLAGQLLVACALVAGCQGGAFGFAPRPAADVRVVYQKAESGRVALLEREVTRLRGDLEDAEQALVEVESGLRVTHTRADAVATVAAARIGVERARARAPWQTAALREATDKLAEAERQTEAGHLGSALFFASRAQRIAHRALEEARIARTVPGARVVRGGRVNLRQGPSTLEKVLSVLVGGTPVFPERQEEGWVLVRTPAAAVGWIRADLLR